MIATPSTNPTQYEGLPRKGGPSSYQRIASRSHRPRQVLPPESRRYARVEGVSVADDFYDRVRRAADGTAFLVERTAEGFDVRTNVVDAQYYTMLFAEGVRQVFTHHVAVDQERGSYTITDDAYDLDWQAGVAADDGIPAPHLRATVSRQLGTIKRFSTRKTWALDDSGTYKKVVDYSFNSEDGRRMIREAGDALGLRQRMGTITKIGLVAAVLGGAGAIVTVVVLLVLAG